MNKRREYPVFLQQLYEAKYLTRSVAELMEIALDIDLTTSAEQSFRLLDATTRQAKCPLYQRRARHITASFFKRVCRTNMHTPAMSLLKTVCYPERMKFMCKATSYGCNHEAEEAYLQHMYPKHVNVRVSLCGLFINTEFPIQGASPDGIVECNCCGEGVLEIKCPYCVRDCTEETEFFLEKKSNT